MLLFIAIDTHADLSPDDQLLLNEVMEDHHFASKYLDKEILKSKEKLIEVEDTIDRLKKIASVNPNEPKIFFAISRLYGVRDDMLRRHLIFKDRKDWFSIPIVQESLQGIRDNLTEVARLLEEGKGASISVSGRISPIISVQLFERFQRLNLKQNPKGIECNDANLGEGEDCWPMPYEEYALKKLLEIAGEYQGYGYFDDADRLLKEIENLSEEGKQKVAELRPLYLEERKNFSPSEETKFDMSIKLPGGTPKPITIRGIDAIEENHKAALEAYHRSKTTEANASIASVKSSFSSSSSFSSPAKSQSVTIPEKNIFLKSIGIFLSLIAVVIFLVWLARKKSKS